MLKIFIDFSPNPKDPHITNGIKCYTDVSKVGLEDLLTALGVCVNMRRSSSILDSMIIVIDKNNVEIIPTDKEFNKVEVENARYVPLNHVPYAHQFFKDLRKDINVGIQDHLSLEAPEKPTVKKSGKSKVVRKGGVLNKKWRKK